MAERIRRRLILFLLCAGLAPAQTTFIFSMDGLGYQFFTQSKAAAPLQALHRFAKRGATAAGIQPAFPSTTANSHCALWTGAYGDLSHITANAPPVLPRAEHTFLERGNGYLATQLAIEPLWVKAGKAGVATVTYQATQGLPFLPINTHEHVVTFNSYQSRQFAPHLILHRKDLTFENAQEFHFKHGPLVLHGKLRPGGVQVEGINVDAAPAEVEPPSNRPLARRFSEGLYLDDPTPSVIYFRLFEYTRDDLLLYVSPIVELANTRGEAKPLLKEAGGVFGNSYWGSALTVPQAMETTELLARQNYRQVKWLHRHYAPKLFVGYFPVADELLHHFLGTYARGDKDAAQWMQWGFTIVDRWSQEIVRLPARQDTLFIVSDHGMAAASRLVNVNEILRRAGLSGVASYVYDSILLNTTDWKNGTVADPVAVRDKVQAALAAVRNPDPVFPGFYTPEKDGAKYGIGGPAGSNLYFDLAPGYAVRDSAKEIFPPVDRPFGEHGMRPDREDMLAVLMVVGPGFKPGTKWPRMKSIEVAPLVLKTAGAIR